MALVALHALEGLVQRQHALMPQRIALSRGLQRQELEAARCRGQVRFQLLPPRLQPLGRQPQRLGQRLPRQGRQLAPQRPRGDRLRLGSFVLAEQVLQQPGDVGFDGRVGRQVVQLAQRRLGRRYQRQFVAVFLFLLESQLDGLGLGVGVDAGDRVGGVAPSRVHGVVDDLGLEAGDAAEAPHLQGDSHGQLIFEDAGGPVALHDVVAEGVPLGGVFAGDDGAVGAQAVFGGVLGRALLAFVGARAGGLGRHDVPPG